MNPASVGPLYFRGSVGLFDEGSAFSLGGGPVPSTFSWAGGRCPAACSLGGWARCLLRWPRLIGEHEEWSGAVSDRPEELSTCSRRNLRFGPISSDAGFIRPRP